MATTVANSPLATLRARSGCSKLDPVADGEDPTLGTKHFDTGRTLGIVLDRSTIIDADGDSIVFRVYGLD